MQRAIALSQIENQHIDEESAMAIEASLRDIGIMTEEQQLQMSIEASMRDQERMRRRASGSLEEGEVSGDEGGMVR